MTGEEVLDYMRRVESVFIYDSVEVKSYTIKGIYIRNSSLVVDVFNSNGTITVNLSDLYKSEEEAFINSRFVN